MKLLQNIYAADVMECDVVTFTPSTPIEDALRTFEDSAISGAPVVDAAGKIVGMLSSADVARPSHLRRGRIGGEGGAAAMREPRDVEGEEVVLEMEDYGQRMQERPTVGDWMSTGVHFVGPEWTLPRVCRLMKGQHIHRVPVVKDGRLVGIISSFDVVCCVADGVVNPERRSAAR